MKRIISSLIFAIIILTALTAGGKQDKTPAPAGPGTASGEGRSINASYKIEKTNEGSRSEGRSHVLAVNGCTLPDVFTLVYAADALYRFATPSEPWGDGGYVLDRNNKSAPFADSDAPITDEDWSLGWYEGGKKKKGTPRSWVYVERDSLKAFVNPDELDRFIAWKELKEMPRDMLLQKK